MNLYVALPIIIIIVLLMLFIFINAGRKFVTIKITHWLMLIYIGVLLLAMVAASLIVNERADVQRVQSTKEIYEQRTLVDNLAMEGNIEEIDPKLMIKESNFKYEGTVLEIREIGFGGSSVIVERKKERDGRIDAFAFTSGLYVAGLDFTKELDPPQFGLAEDKFEIYTESNIKSVDLAILKNEFVITQFTEQAKFFDSIEHNDSIVYLRVPENIRIVNEGDLYLRYVGEE